MNWKRKLATTMVAMVIMWVITHSALLLFAPFVLPWYLALPALFGTAYTSLYLAERVVAFTQGEKRSSKAWTEDRL